ncbi:TRAP transporter small permease subunit [Shewanella youngdeokensis]|uniref:TRAP transporter small permease protein n=1 Tax=Shewanella youngdeokensis TaxID=2999068 RepID=A0ABZ0K0L4_9GAMM|nr:TRAP transporter small permease subunit [Shewanella sp. DAU334]
MKIIEQWVDRSGRWVSWFTLLMVLITLAVVILRYIFNIGATAAQEMALYLHGAILTLAAGYTLKHDGHVRVDIFYRRFSMQARNWVDFLGTLLFLFPVSIYILYASFDYVMTSWHYSETSVEAGGLPFVYIQKSLLLGLPLSLMLQGLVELLRLNRLLFPKSVGKNQ